MVDDNSLKPILESGDPAYGASVASFSPAVVEAYGHLGLDFVWVDIEHTGDSPTDSTRLENLARAADASGTELLVRPPSGEPWVIRKILDAGVRNVVVPRVRSAEAVERAVRAGRFDYDGEPGRRGIGAARSSLWGDRIDRDYPGQEDDDVLVGAMVEEADAIGAIDDILSVPHLGFAFLGHWDLTMTMGREEPNDDAVQDAIETYAAASREAGVPYGRSDVPAEPDQLRDAADDGCQLFLLGDEINAARAQLGGVLDGVR